MNGTFYVEIRTLPQFYSPSIVASSLFKPKRLVSPSAALFFCGFLSEEPDEDQSDLTSRVAAAQRRRQVLELRL